MKKWFGVALLTGAFLMPGCGHLGLEPNDFKCGIAYGLGYDRGINELAPEEMEESYGSLSVKQSCYEQGYIDGRDYILDVREGRQE
jgi:hypothetical protein